MESIIWFADLGRDAIEVAGGKGANLGELTSAGLPVPPGFVVTTTAYDRFVGEAGLTERVVGLARDVPPQDLDRASAASAEILTLFAGSELPADLAASITGAYAELAALDPAGDGAVAVRSSATAEDLSGASFAGQQDTYLNLVGADAVLAAVRDCWASLWTPRAIAYRQREGIDPATVSLAVVVQTLVDADSAGVMFTANPVNGRRDQLVISAAWGLGESVVGGTVGTDTVVVQREGDVAGRLRVRSTEVGDKQVRTVRTPDGTEEVPVTGPERDRAVLTSTQAIELAGLGVRIAEHYAQPMDIEWAHTAAGFQIVQARPITALPEPVGDAPTDWSVPNRRAMYARASIIEQLPDPLTPLFGDMIPSAVVGSLEKLVRTVFVSALPPGGLTFPLVNGYAYYAYDWAAIARMSALSPAFLPRLFSRKEGNAEQRWREEFRPRYRAVVAEWAAASDLESTTILHAVEELLFAGAEYYTSVQMIIPIAASTESLFTGLYQATMRRDGDPSAATFVMGTDSSPMRAERALYALARWCADHPDLMAALGADRSPDDLAFGPSPDDVPADLWTSWQQRIGAYLDTYGHAVYNLDFANPVAADSPGPVIDTIKFYAGGTVDDPKIRQERLAAERKRATAELLGRLDPIRRGLVGPILRRAQEIAPIREDALADVGLAWPTIRRLLRQLGQRLVEAGALREADEVFWLRWEEATAMAAALDADRPVPEVTASTIEQRKTVWRGQRSVSPPQLLPDNRLNALMEGFMPSHAGDQTGPVLTGLGASGGSVTAEAHLITDQADFGSMQPGRVLVAKITTPAYTPLFALASAVVTDVGGPLSHSSIVAREYGIPAVLGTGVATQRIRTGQTITVDGSAGKVILDGGTGSAVETGATDGRWRRRATTAAVTAAGAVVLVTAIRRRRRRSRA